MKKYIIDYVNSAIRVSLVLVSLTLVYLNRPDLMVASLIFFVPVGFIAAQCSDSTKSETKQKKRGAKRVKKK